MHTHSLTFSRYLFGHLNMIAWPGIVPFKIRITTNHINFKCHMLKISLKISVYISIKIKNVRPFCEISNSHSGDLHPDDGGSKHFWHIGQFLWDYMAQYCRRQSFSWGHSVCTVTKAQVSCLKVLLIFLEIHVAFVIDKAFFELGFVLYLFITFFLSLFLYFFC
jgi:hypothetical protein